MVIDLVSLTRNTVQLHFGRGDGNYGLVPAGMIYGYPKSQYSYDILGWEIQSDVATTATIDIYVASNPNTIPTVANTICNTHYPSLTASTWNTGILTNWSSAVIPAGCRVAANIISNSAASALDLYLTLRRI